MGRAQSNRQSTGSNMSQRLPSVTWPPAPTLKHDGRPPRRAPPRRRPRSPQRQPSPAGACPVTDFWLHGSRNRRRHPLRKSRPPGRRRPYANRRRRHRPGPLRHVDCQSPGLHRTAHSATTAPKCWPPCSTPSACGSSPLGSSTRRTTAFGTFRRCRAASCCSPAGRVSS